MSDNGRQQIAELREALLRLHKALLDTEKREYSRHFGAVGSPAAFLQLLNVDPWFAWLHPLSELIASIDETLESDEPLTDYDANAIVKAARELLSPSEEGQGFARHYFEALQRDPDVVLAHASVTKLRK